MEDDTTNIMKEVCCGVPPMIYYAVSNLRVAYPYPNDEQEIDRLDLQHHMFKLVMGQKLYHVPLKDPQQILDIGTGSGIWPIEMGMIANNPLHA